MMIVTKKLNTLFKSLEREQYRSRDNRENGRYWKTCWETFQEAEKVLRGLMGHWRYPKGNHRNLQTEVENFPEIARFCHVPQYPPPEYFGGWYYIGRDIRFKICTRYGKLYGKDIIIVSGFMLQHGYMNAENAWSVPILAGEYADPAYRPKNMQSS